MFLFTSQQVPEQHSKTVQRKGFPKVMSCTLVQHMVGTCAQEHGSTHEKIRSVLKRPCHTFPCSRRMALLKELNAASIHRRKYF